MIRFIENIRAGILKPGDMKTAESTKRSYNLQLSLCHDIERTHKAGINSLNIDPIEGRHLLSGCSDGSIHIHDMYNFTGSPNFTSNQVCEVTRDCEYAHKHGVECAQWYPFDTGLFVTSSTDKQLKVWDTNTMKPVDVYELNNRVSQHDISEQCIVAVAGQSNQVQLVDLKSGSHIQELRGHTGSVLCCRWSARQGHHLATGGCDNRVLLWDVRSAKSCLLTFNQYSRPGTSGPITAHNGLVNGLSFTADALFLLSYGTDNMLRLWNTLTGRKETVNYGKIANTSKRSKTIAVTMDARPGLVYVPSENKILVFEVHTGVKVDTLVGHYNNVMGCVYERHRHELYSAGKDMIVLVWTPDKSQEEAFIREQDRHLVQRCGSRDVRPTDDAWSSDEA